MNVRIPAFLKTGSRSLYRFVRRRRFSLGLVVAILLFAALWDRTARLQYEVLANKFQAAESTKHLLSVQTNISTLIARVGKLETPPAPFDPFAVASPVAGTRSHAAASTSSRPVLSDEIYYHLGYGLTLLHEGNLAEAEEMFQSAIVLDPTNPVAAQGLKATEKLLRADRAPKARRGRKAAASIFDYASYRLKHSRK